MPMSSASDTFRASYTLPTIRFLLLPLAGCLMPPIIQAEEPKVLLENIGKARKALGSAGNDADRIIAGEALNKANQAILAECKTRKTSRQALIKQKEKAKLAELDLVISDLDCKPRECRERKRKYAKLKLEQNNLLATRRGIISKLKQLSGSEKQASEKKLTDTNNKIAGISDELRLKEANSTEACGPEPKQKPEDPGYSTKNFFMHVGLATLAPFKIKDSPTAPATNVPFYVDNTSSLDTNFYVEFRHRKRWAWEKAENADRTESLEYRYNQWKYLLPYDHDFRLGFTFGSGTDSSSGNAVLGSSDLNVRMAFGWPLVIATTSNGTVYSAGMELLYESISNRSVQDAHNRLALGAGFSAGWEDQPFSPTTRCKKDNCKRVYEATFRFTFNKMESPNLSHSSVITANSETRPGVRGKNGFPEFRDATFGKVRGLEGEFQIPFGKNGYYVVDGGIFNGDVDPNPWYLRLGITVPLDTVFGLVKDVFGKTANQ